MPQTVEATLTVNGRESKIDPDPQRSLLEVLREDLQLTGTKYGCGEGACGACAVMVDGKVTFSCSTPVAQVLGKKITTIEGLARGDALHPAQQAFIDKASFQCGYCTAGMIVATANLLERKSQPNEAEIAQALGGHVCRCCTYPRILEAVKHAAASMAAAELGRK
jgi:aerobic-type carbon monoxide dehydrogenase small subunit (CoxS/CutS family)